MGSNTSYGQNPIINGKLIDSETDYEVYETSGGEQVERYIVGHDQTSNFEQNYEFRIANKHSDLVDVIYAGPIHTFMGCTQRYKYEVVTQRISYRLQFLSDIRSLNSFVLLNSMLRGYRDLFIKHGAFPIKQDMIGINRSNKVKLWLNPNFAINKPVETDHQQPQGIHQKMMVYSILSLLNSKARQDELWRQFYNPQIVQNLCSFEEGRNYLEQFLRKRNIRCEEVVVDIFNKKRQETCQQNTSLRHINFQQSLAFHPHNTILNTSNPSNPASIKPQSIENKVEAKQPRDNRSIVRFSEYQGLVSPFVPNKNASIGFDESRLTNHIPILHETKRNQAQPSTKNSVIQFSFNRRQAQPYSVPIFSSLATKHLTQPPLQQYPPPIIHSPQPPGINQQNVVEVIATNLPSNQHMQGVKLMPQEEPQPFDKGSAPPTENIGRQCFENEDHESFEDEQPQVFVGEVEANQESYKINVQQVSSEQSLHQKLSPLLRQEEHSTSVINFEEELDEVKVEVVGGEAQAATKPLETVETIKNQINSCLVDTKQIKQNINESTTPSPTPQWSKPNLSYKQMRRLLLDHIQT